MFSASHLTVKPVAPSSSLPKGKRVGNVKRNGAKSEAGKISREDIVAIRGENKVLRESGAATSEGDHEFKALYGKAFYEEEDLPAYKRRKINSSAVM